MRLPNARNRPLNDGSPRKPAGLWPGYLSAV
jgi:hypothetical protein